MAEITELMFMFLRATQRPSMKLKPKPSAGFFVLNSLNAIKVHCFWRRKFWKIWIFNHGLMSFDSCLEKSSIRCACEIYLRRRWNVVIISHTSEFNINSTVLFDKFAENERCFWVNKKRKLHVFRFGWLAVI